MVVYGGVDKAFNDKRVFPPGELVYPDIFRDEDFFDLIGCPHLASRYFKNKIDYCKTDCLAPSFQKLPKTFIEPKKKNTDRLKADIIDRIDWRIWEVQGEEVGKYPRESKALSKFTRATAKLV